jgi:hypothetical protein
MKPPGFLVLLAATVVVADFGRVRAEEVAQYTRKILAGDKSGRRALYRQLGLPPGDSVR